MFVSLQAMNMSVAERDHGKNKWIGSSRYLRMGNARFVSFFEIYGRILNHKKISTYTIET